MLGDDARSRAGRGLSQIQTVKIVVPFAAGGGVDGVAWILISRLADELGQSIVIENKGGAGGMLGAFAVAQSPPDGYTILFGTRQHARNECERLYQAQL